MTVPSCPTCGFIRLPGAPCRCTYEAEHDPGCPFRRAATCPVGIECDHGHDVCPVCDPCTCERHAGIEAGGRGFAV